MAIPFCEPNESHQQQQQQPLQAFYEEVDQVDGPAMSVPPNIATNEMPTPAIPPLTTEQDVMAWKILALTMCKALKDHYQKNIFSSAAESSSTAVIQILPNGQVQPSWN